LPRSHVDTHAVEQPEHLLVGDAHALEIGERQQVQSAP
jgi:hypothetical protein